MSQSPGAASRQSGHPKVSNRELQKVLDQIRSTPKQDVSSKPLLARARGLLRAALIRENAMFADEALGVLGRLQHHRGLQLSEEELYRFAEPLVKRSLRWRCPSDEEAAEELIRQRGDLNLPEDQVFEKSLSLLATQLIPAWLEDAQNARADRLKMASESWESLGVEDLEGAVLHVSVSLELGDRRALRRSLEVILSQTTDLRLVLQPAFLADLEARGLVSLDTRNSSNHWCQHVQRAASLACLGEKAGVLLRRHGALLLSEGQACQMKKNKSLQRTSNLETYIPQHTVPDPQVCNLKGGTCKMTQQGSELLVFVNECRFANGESKHQEALDHVG